MRSMRSRRRCGGGPDTPAPRFVMLGRDCSLPLRGGPAWLVNSTTMEQARAVQPVLTCEQVVDALTGVEHPNQPTFDEPAERDRFNPFPASVGYTLLRIRPSPTASPRLSRPNWLAGH